METVAKMETGKLPLNGAPPEFFVSQLTKEVFKTREELEKHYAGFVKLEPGQAVVRLQFQKPIEPPVSKPDLQKQYSSGDEVTVNSWFDEWKYNKKENLKRFKIFDRSVSSENGKFAYKPVIIAGSGPSLKKNAHLLKDRGEIGLVSCLHNFGFFEDLGVKPDYYMNLDAGNITLWEVSQGGTKTEEEYWEATKDHTLVTALHCNPSMHDKWRGKILWYDTALQGFNEGLYEEFPALKDFRTVFQTGGNTLGACHYMAKAILGTASLIFVGADFAFSYDRKFHPFDSPYDAKFDGLIPATDVFGNRVFTWPSYYGFKTWFEYIAMGGSAGTPGTYTNCTEGGILGAYPQGNIFPIRQRALLEVMVECGLHKKLPEALNDKTRLWTLY